MATIEQRTTKTGAPTWRVKFRLDKRQMSRSFTSEKHATAWRDLVNVAGPQLALDQLENAVPVQPRTVPEQVQHHIDNLTGITDGTRATYQRILDKDIRKQFAGVQLAAFTREHATAWINRLDKDDTLTGKTIRNRHALLTAAIGRAVDDHLIDSNPCHRIRMPKRATDTEMCFLTKEQFWTLLGGIPERFRPLTLTLATTGMRFGEATALRVCDVDVKHASIHVRRAWKTTGDGAKREIGVPKSKKSVRTVSAPAATMKVLGKLIEGRGPLDYVFVGTTGKPVKQGTFYRNAWVWGVAALSGDVLKRVKTDNGRYAVKVITRGAGKHPRVHDLRHTFASWAIQDGVPLPVLQRQMGHESITTTVDTYGHLARADFDALAAVIGNGLPALDTLPVKQQISDSTRTPQP